MASTLLTFIQRFEGIGLNAKFNKIGETEEDKWAGDVLLELKYCTI